MSRATQPEKVLKRATFILRRVQHVQNNNLSDKQEARGPMRVSCMLEHELEKDGRTGE
jgi:hypothetical protein